MIIFIWLLNFFISVLNAWGCGKSWTETKAVGKFPHLLNWCGAIMSAIGFTWCYMLIAGWIGYTIPFDHKVHGVTVNSPYFNEKDLSFFFDMGYVILVVPLIGSGMVITVNSWCVAWRSRTFGDLLLRHIILSPCTKIYTRQLQNQLAYSEESTAILSLHRVVVIVMIKKAGYSC